MFSKADTSSLQSYGANSFEIENLDKSGQKFPSNDSLQPESTKAAEHSVVKKIQACKMKHSNFVKKVLEQLFLNVS